MDRHAPITPSVLGIPPMPEHWQISRSKAWGVPFFSMMLFIGIGKRTPEEFWESIYPGCPDFKEERDEIRKRIAHINLVVSEKVLSASG